MRNSLAIAAALAATAAVAARQLPGRESQAMGTGVISGRVIEAGTDAPIANARVSLHQTRGDTPIGISPRSEQLTTDDSGDFAFHNLPAGQFSIEASAEGYQPGAVGKRRPEGEPAWISLEDGQTFREATIELFRGGIITGTVRNDRGEPMREVHVETWFRTGSGRFEHRHGAITNEAGIYRITAVPAGDHLVVGRVWHDTIRPGPPNATSPCNPQVPRPPDGAPQRPAPIEKPKRAEGEWFTRLPRWIPEPAPDDRGQPRTIATTIYPGVSEVSQASVVRILGGEDRTDIDLQFRPTHATSVSGRIVPLPGKKIGQGTEVTLRLPGGPSDLSEHRAWVQPDHTFRFLGVQPGSYLIEVQLQEAVSCDVIVRDADHIRTEIPLDVPPNGLDDVIVHMTAGAAMHGGIRFEGTTQPAQIMDIWMLPTSDASARIGEWDGESRVFAGGLLPGGYALRVLQNGDPGWFVRSMTLGRLDLVTHPVVIDRDDVHGVEVTMTDRPSPLTGRIVDAKGGVVRDATVVLFPADRTSWLTAHHHLVGFARTRSLDGTYSFEHLVPGDYFIAAVDERRMDDWPQAQFLEHVARQAVRIRVDPGRARTLQLTIRAR